jgi:excisionase family DNA binding protein
MPKNTSNEKETARRTALSAAEHLKAEEIASELNVSKRTILNWHADGILPASIAVGRVIRFNLEECRAALKQHAQN